MGGHECKGTKKFSTILLFRLGGVQSWVPMQVYVYCAILCEPFYSSWSGRGGVDNPGTQILCWTFRDKCAGTSNLMTNGIHGSVEGKCSPVVRYFILRGDNPRCQICMRTSRVIMCRDVQAPLEQIIKS